MDVRPGQAHDAPLLKPMLKRTAARVDGVDQVVGDKAFDGAAQRRACAAIGAEAVIPAKANRVDPEPLDKAAYRERNRVERLFAKLKEFRRVATRYEKLKQTFLGMIHLALGFIHADARSVVLVVDNLNTRGPGCLYEAFEPAQARRIARKLKWHHAQARGLAERGRGRAGRLVEAVPAPGHRIDRRAAAGRPRRGEDERNARMVKIRWRPTAAERPGPAAAAVPDRRQRPRASGREGDRCDRSGRRRS